MPTAKFYIQVDEASQVYIGFRANDLVYTNNINLELGVVEEAFLPLTATLVKGAAMDQPSIVKIRFLLENKKNVLAMCSTFLLGGAIQNLRGEAVKGSIIQTIGLPKKRHYT